MSFRPSDSIDDNFLRRPKSWAEVAHACTMAIAMGWQRPDNVAGTAAPAVMVGLFVASAGLLFGYDTG